MRSAVGDPEQVAGLDGGGERALVDNERGLREAAAHLLLALPRHAPLGNPGVAREEALQGLGLDPGLGGERARGRGRGGEAADRVALLLQKRTGAVQHGGLAATGIALDADGAVFGGEDELHRRLLAVGQGTVTERLVDSAGAHRRGAASLTGLHQPDGFLLVGDGAVGGEQALGAGQARGVERAGGLARRELAFDGGDVGPARVEGERGGEQVGAGEHRLALGEMRHRPVHGLGRRTSRCVFARRRARLRRAGSGDGLPVGGGPAAGLSGRLPAGLPRLRREPRRVEAEPSGLGQPALAQRVAVDVALGRAGHQRRALGEALVVRGGAAAALGHRRLDLGAPGRERLDHRAGDTGDLEAPVGMGLLDIVAEPGETPRKLAPVERAEQHLRFVEPLVRHRAPLSVFGLDHVGNHRMGVERRVEVARGVVAEGGDDGLLVAGAHHAAGLRILHAGLGDVPLEPGEGARDGPVVGVHDAGIAADQADERDRFGGREGEVAARPVRYLAVFPDAPETLPGPVGHMAFEHGAEDLGLDRAFEAELGRAAAGPGAGVAVLGIVLRVVAVALVVARPLRRRGDGADRGHHVRSRRRDAASRAAIPPLRDLPWGLAGPHPQAPVYRAAPKSPPGRAHRAMAAHRPEAARPAGPAFRRARRSPAPMGLSRPASPRAPPYRAVPPLACPAAHPAPVHPPSPEPCPASAVRARPAPARPRAARTARRPRALHVVELDGGDRERAGEAEIAREVGQAHDLRGERQRAQLALGRQRDAVADGVGAVGEALGDLLDLGAPEAVGRPLGGVAVGGCEHHAGAAEPRDGLGAVPPIEVAQRRDDLDAEHEAAAELARFGKAGLERGHLVQRRQLVEDDPDPPAVVLFEREQRVDRDLEPGRDEAPQGCMLVAARGEEQEPLPVLLSISSPGSRRACRYRAAAPARPDARSAWRAR